MKNRTQYQREIKVARELLANGMQKHVLNFGTASCALLEKGNEYILESLDRFVAKRIRVQGEKEHATSVPLALKDEDVQHHTTRVDAWKAHCMKRLRKKASGIKDFKSYLDKHADFILDPDPGPNALTDYIRDLQGLQPAGVPGVAPPGDSDRISVLEQRNTALEQRLADLEKPKRGPGRPKKDKHPDDQPVPAPGL